MDFVGGKARSSVLVGPLRPGSLMLKHGARGSALKRAENGGWSRCPFPPSHSLFIHPSSNLQSSVATKLDPEPHGRDAYATFLAALQATRLGKMP
jgi:hypothetical protein